jgi:hypothetical protein
VWKVLNPGARLFVGSDEVRGQLGWQDELRRIAGGTEKVWKHLGKKIIGILFAFRILVSALQAIAY